MGGSAPKTKDRIDGGVRLKDTKLKKIKKVKPLHFKIFTQISKIWKITTPSLEKTLFQGGEMILNENFEKNL